MPSKGTFGPDKAVKQGMVQAAPIGRVIERWCTENWWMDAHGAESSKEDEVGTIGRLADFTGIHIDTLTKVKNGRKEWLEFDNADKIVTFINPMLWMTDPELNEIYQGYNFAWLDLNRPTCREVIDEVFELAGSLTQSKLAALYGVGFHTMHRLLNREEPVAV